MLLITARSLPVTPHNSMSSYTSVNARLRHHDLSGHVVDVRLGMHRALDHAHLGWRRDTAADAAKRPPCGSTLPIAATKISVSVAAAVGQISEQEYESLARSAEQDHGRESPGHLVSFTWLRERFPRAQQPSGVPGGQRPPSAVGRLIGLLDRCPLRAPSMSRGPAAGRARD